MKGISAVIATILMLMITIAMAGVAYMYIQGMFTQQTGVVVDIDETATSCAGTTITVYVRNAGTLVTTGDKVTLSGTNSNGIALTTSVVGGLCTTVASATKLPAGGGAVVCTTTLGNAMQGNNRIVVSGPSNTATGSVYCTG